VVNRQRSDRGAYGGELTERDHAAASGLCIDSAKSVRPKLLARIDFEDGVVFIQGRMDPRHMALTKGVVENGIGQGRIDSETRSRFSVDLDLQRRTGALLIARDVRQLRQCLLFCSRMGAQWLSSSTPCSKMKNSAFLCPPCARESPSHHPWRRLNRLTVVTQPLRTASARREGLARLRADKA
jgi:hypothetical protein